MSEKLESFDDNEVIEPTTPAKDSSSGADSVDSFDDNTVYEVPENQGDKVESKGEPKSKEEGEKNNDLKDKQINAMDDSKAEKEEEADEKTDDETAKGEDEAGKSEDSESDSKEKQETAPKVKMLKARVGDEKTDLHPETELRVKVDGKRVDVPIQELINNYSGKTNWDKKYNELNNEKETFQKESTQYKQELGWLQGHMKTVSEILDDPERSPIDALMHIVDSTNRNPVEYQMKLFKHMQGQVENMAEMDEVEQELYWERQKNAYLAQRQESLSERAKSEKEQASQKAKVDQIRDAQGVSEDQFMEAHSELKELGFDNVTPEQAVNYAVIKPHLDEAESLIQPYEEEMTTDGADKLILELANYLKSGEFTKAEISKLLKEEYASDNGDVDDLEDKVKDFSEKSPPNSSAKVADKGEDHVESFDDFDEQYYGRA